MIEKVEILVEGGNATPGPPLGPALGPLGVNIPQVVKTINEKTKNFSGMKVPVKISIDTTSKDFNIEVGTPPTSSLILRELNIQKGAKSVPGKDNTKGNEVVGDLSMAQVIKIAKMKKEEIFGKNLKKIVKVVIGTCKSMGVTVEGKSPKIVQKDIDAGFYNEYFYKEN